MSRFSYILTLSVCSFITRLLVLLKTRKLYRRINAIGGVPQFRIQGSLIFNSDKKATFVNSFSWSTLGIPRRCKIAVGKDAVLSFKGRVGMSNTVIVATNRIEIGDNVMIGGGVTIVDSDFHSMDWRDWFTDNDAAKASSSPVIIGDNVFIGMNAILLKGVHIGDGAVIGAGSVVTKDIPSNEVWAGNPAKFLKYR